MSTTRKFDRRIEILNTTLEKPERIVDAAVYVNDTMELAEMIAAEVLGKDVDPRVTLEIYDRIDRERLRLVAEREAGKERIPGRKRGRTAIAP